jgi:hypothetical protein
MGNIYGGLGMSVLKAVLHGEWTWGDQTRNVFYFEGDDALVANGQEILDNLVDIIMQEPLAFTDAYSYTGATFYDLEAPGVPGTFLTVTGGAVPGTSAADPQAGQIAFLVNFWAASVRPNRKRTYFAGMAEDTITDGLWGPTQVTRFQTVADDLLDFDASLGSDAVFSTVWYDPIGEVLWANNLTQARAQNVPATQRRRRRGTGI